MTRRSVVQQVNGWLGGRLPVLSPRMLKGNQNRLYEMPSSMDTLTHKLTRSIALWLSYVSIKRLQKTTFYAGSNGA
jgi:hypothetical protein